MWKRSTQKKHLKPISNGNAQVQAQQMNDKKLNNTAADGKKPAPVDMVSIPLLTRLLYIQPVVVWDFWTINRSNKNAQLCQCAAELRRNQGDRSALSAFTPQVASMIMQNHYQNDDEPK